MVSCESGRNLVIAHRAVNRGHCAGSYSASWTRGAECKSAFTRVFDALWVHRRSGIAPDSEFLKVPGRQRTISCCAAPGDAKHAFSQEIVAL